MVSIDLLESIFIEEKKTETFEITSRVSQKNALTYTLFNPALELAIY